MLNLNQFLACVELIKELSKDLIFKEPKARLIAIFSTLVRLQPSLQHLNDPLNWFFKT